MITSGRQIVQAAAKFKAKMSVGLDLWAIKDFCQSTPDGLDLLAELLMERGHEITVPTQWLVNLMAKIPKKRRPSHSGHHGEWIPGLHSAVRGSREDVEPRALT